MTSPFIFDVADLLGSALQPEHRSTTGPSPTRIGADMIALPEGAPVTVDAVLTPLGGAVMVDADITAPLTGQCVRCLRPLSPTEHVHVSQVFRAPEGAALDPWPGDAAGEHSEDEAPPRVVDDQVDLLQTVIDELGLLLPFNPTCPDGCDEQDTDVPAPDGISGEEERNATAVDPRWAGLEKFL